MTSTQAPVKIVCLKFGTKFGPDYVNRLARAVSAHLGRPHEFVCLTDDPVGLDPAIRAEPIPDFGPPRDRWTYRGAWGKLAIVSPGLFDDDDIVLYLDLDVMVTGPLDPFIECIEREGGLFALREWNPTIVRALPVALRPDRGAQGSILCWRMREQRHIAVHFKHNWRDLQEKSWGERTYWKRIAWRPQYFPVDWVASFKRHCTLYYPLSLLRPTPRRPEWARIIVFHGHPTPDALADPSLKRWGGGRRRGWGPVPWIVDYFRKYGD